MLATAGADLQDGAGGRQDPAEDVEDRLAVAQRGRGVPARVAAPILGGGPAGAQETVFSARLPSTRIRSLRAYGLVRMGAAEKVSGTIFRP